MARKLTSDKWLFTATLLLVCISVVMVYSASAVMAMEQNHAPYYYLFKQLAWVLLGRPVNGASRWLLLGPLGVQPSELAKIAVIFCTAALLERRMDRIDEIGYSLVPIGITVGVIVALIL